MTFNWEEVKDDIERLYMKEGRSLKEVREILKHTKNFSASVRAYKDKLEEWGYRKYNARRKVPAAVSPALAQDLDDERCCKSTQVASGLLSGLDSGVVRTNVMEVEHELERQACVARDQRMILSKASRNFGRQVMEPDIEEVRESRELATTLHPLISQAVKTLEERLLTSVNVQASRTTILSVCLPRDASISLLSLSIEIGLLGFLAGEKRVQEKQLEIEDGVTRGKLVRTEALSRRYKPTMKFVLRWAFEDVLKAGVVCPECDSISEAENDVPVECPNPDCQMIFSTFFRTEEEKINFDLLRRAMNSFPTASTTTRTILLSNPHLEDLCDEPEDSPGRLKRVNIRHSSVRMGSAKQSASKSLIKHKRKNKSQPRRANSAEANDGKLPPWPDKQAMDATGVPRVSSGLTLSQSIFSLRFAQVQGFPEQSWSLSQSMPTPNHPLRSELMDTWTSTNNHLIDMGPYDQFGSPFNFNNTANGPFLAPATYQTSGVPPPMDLPEWTSLDQYPAFGGNGMWHMSPGMNISHNLTEEGLMQTGEDLNVGDMDLLNFIDFEQVDSGINWF